jgi:hypothetical protein
VEIGFEKRKEKEKSGIGRARLGWLRASGMYCPPRHATRMMDRLGRSRSGRSNTFFLFLVSFITFCILAPNELKPISIFF